jgi:catechol 2,3-dioxygenase-like lactoylglutathione lyase family enzyme
MISRGIIFGLMVAVTAFAWGAQPATAASTPGLTGIAHVAMRVGDLDQSRAFFSKLGFEEAFAMDKGGAPTEAFVKVNDRQFIELYPRRDASAAVGFMHVCFEAADINAVYQDYVDQGLTPTAMKRAGAGNLLFTLQGPDQPGLPSDLRGAATQNIEYTQYMPGSRHTLDRGQHLGPDRIAERIVAVGIPFTHPAEAETFYIDKLSFQRDASSGDREYAVMTLPSSADQQIEFLSEESGASPNTLPFRLIFSVPNLRRTADRLRTLGFASAKHGKTLTIHDPDGDTIVFAQTGR